MCVFCSLNNNMFQLHCGSIFFVVQSGNSHTQLGAVFLKFPYLFQFLHSPYQLPCKVNNMKLVCSCHFPRLYSSLQSSCLNNDQLNLLICNSGCKLQVSIQKQDEKGRYHVLLLADSGHTQVQAIVKGCMFPRRTEKLLHNYKPYCKAAGYYPHKQEK